MYLHHIYQNIGIYLYQMYMYMLVCVCAFVGLYEYVLLIYDILHVVNHELLKYVKFCVMTSLNVSLVIYSPIDS